MKPILAIALSVLISGSALASSVISPTEAKQHVGEKDIIVAGFVTQVVENAGNILITFDGAYPRQKFTGVIPQSKIEDAGWLIYLNGLPGQFVAISGNIQSAKGRPQIIVDVKKQFMVAQR